MTEAAVEPKQKPSAVDSLKEKAGTPTPEEPSNGVTAVESLKEKVGPREPGAPDVDDVIGKYGMTGMDPYEDYEKTAQIADELDISWLEARDQILEHGQNSDRSGYGRAYSASRVLQVQQGMDPHSVDYAAALIKTTTEGYYKTTPSERKQWAEKVVAEGIDPLQWIKENLREGNVNPLKKYLSRAPKGNSDDE